MSLEQQLERLTEAYLGSVIPLPEYQRRRRELEQKAQALEVQAKQLEAEVDHQAELAGWVRSVEAFCARVRTGLAQATFEQKRQLVELLIDRVVVTDAEVEIRYVIPLSPESEHIRFCHLRKDYFDHEQTLVSDRGIFNTQGIVVSDEHPLAVEARRLADGLSIQTHFAAFDLEVACE